MTANNIKGPIQKIEEEKEESKSSEKGMSSESNKQTSGRPKVKVNLDSNDILDKKDESSPFVFNKSKESKDASLKSSMEMPTMQKSKSLFPMDEKKDSIQGGNGLDLS